MNEGSGCDTEAALLDGGRRDIVCCLFEFIVEIPLVALWYRVYKLVMLIVSKVL